MILKKPRTLHYKNERSGLIYKLFILIILFQLTQHFQLHLKERF